MGFLDNSGDIILDAVLTDTGRKRIAQGDGSFEITKFAFGDDEIDYSKFEENHPSGSSHQDLDILKTPVMEPVSDNQTALKSKLLSIPRTDILYLPVIKPDQSQGHSKWDTGDASGSYIVTVDDDTTEHFDPSSDPVIFGDTKNNIQQANTFRVDQGIDKSKENLPQDLVETQYMIKIDSRLGNIVDPQGNTAQPAFIDDDFIATYLFTQNTDPGFVEFIKKPAQGAGGSNVIAGEAGTKLEFGIKAAADLTNDDHLFNTIGGTSNITGKKQISVKHIDTNVEIVGGTTGRNLLLPTRYIKQDN